MTPLVAAWVLWGVVDQIDGPTAAIEWDETEIQWIPSEWLPPETREGDHIEVRIRRTPARSRRKIRAVEPRLNQQRRGHDTPRKPN